MELHLGIMLLMFGQWFVTNYDLEQQINLAEGETKNFAHDIRSVELAIISDVPDDPTTPA